MKAPEVIQVTYGLGGVVFIVKSTDPDVIKITDVEPRLTRVDYENSTTEVIVSDQMVIRYRVDASLVDAIDMDIARVS
jgi:hypothetical protein